MRIRTFQIALAVIGLTQGLSACRFGNYTDESPKVDPFTGYYLTEPQHLSLVVTVAGQTRSQMVSLSLLPGGLKTYFTNPVLFMWLDSSSGLSGISSPDNTSQQLPIRIASDGSLSFSNTSQPRPYGIDPSCVDQVTLLESGKLNQGSYPNMGGHSISGRLEVAVRVMTSYTGPCQSTFAALAQCYSDPNQCGGATSSENAQLQSGVAEVFQPWIDAGILTAAEIEQITAQGYEVSYQ